MGPEARLRGLVCIRGSIRGWSRCRVAACGSWAGSRYCRFEDDTVRELWWYGVWRVSLFANLVASRWQGRKEQRRGGRKAERFVWRGGSATVVVKHETSRLLSQGWRDRGRERRQCAGVGQGGSLGWDLGDSLIRLPRGSGGVIRARDAGRGSALGARWESWEKGLHKSTGRRRGK